MPFKLNQNRRHHISRQRHKVANWPDYEASLRQREPGRLVYGGSDCGLGRGGCVPGMSGSLGVKVPCAT